MDGDFSLGFVMSGNFSDHLPVKLPDMLRENSENIGRKQKRASFHSQAESEEFRKTEMFGFHLWIQPSRTPVTSFIICGQSRALTADIGWTSLSTTGKGKGLAVPGSESRQVIQRTD